MSYLCPDDIISYDEDLKRNSLYTVIKKIGEGAQGIILLIRKDEELFAAKVFKYYTDYSNKSFDLIIGESTPLLEINFGLKINHPYIIKGVDFVMGQRYIFYIMKKADIDLGSFFKIYNFPIDDRLQIIFRLACGFDYIHQSGYIHGDIKSINILLDRENVFISDFGLISLVDDKDFIRPFQTLNYRPPENILFTEKDMPLLIYREIFNENVIRKHRSNFKLGESWSFGVLCLDIIYNKSNVVLSTSIYKSKFISIDHKKYNFPYNIFIDTLSKLYNIEKYPYMEKENVCTLVKSMLGDVHPDLEELLKLVCEKLLVIDQSKRSTIQEFLKDDYFKSIGLENIKNVDAYPQYKIQKMYTPKSKFLYTIKNLELLVEWIIKIYNELELGLVILMNTIDFIIQKYHLYVKSPKDYHLFGAAVLWIVTRLYNFEVFVDITFIMKITQYYYSQTDIFDILILILKTEKGIFNFESLYSQLPSENLLIKGVSIMKDVSIYINDYKSPSNLAYELLKNETDEEKKNRNPKTYQYIKV